MLGRVREKTKQIIKPMAYPFVKLNISPNVVSFLGIPLALIAAYFIIQKDFPLAFIFALLTILMDFIDGTVAKMQGKISNFGNYFETMIDKYAEFFLFAPFVLFYPVATVLALGFSMMEAYAKPRAALVIISDNRDWPAIGEHADRLLLFLIGLLAAIFIPVIYGFETMEIFLYLIAALTLIGGIQRIMFAKKLIEEAERNGNILPYLKKDLGHGADK